MDKKRTVARPTHGHLVVRRPLGKNDAGSVSLRLDSVFKKKDTEDADQDFVAETDYQTLLGTRKAKAVRFAIDPVARAKMTVYAIVKDS